MIGAVTGGRDYWPTLAELERATEVFRDRGATIVRDGDAKGVDRTWAAWAKARGIAARDSCPADWDKHGKSAGMIRNRAMLIGDQPDMFEHTDRPRVGVLAAFTGGAGTAGCVREAKRMGVEVVQVECAPEPRIWNRHHGTAPKPWVYVGRSPDCWSPLANPDPMVKVEGVTRAVAAAENLGRYRAWLWARIDPASSRRDPVVCEALGAITADHFLVCSCWPLHCHAEVIVRAWRWSRDRAE